MKVTEAPLDGDESEPAELHASSLPPVTLTLTWLGAGLLVGLGAGDLEGADVGGLEYRELAEAEAEGVGVGVAPFLVVTVEGCVAFPADGDAPGVFG